MVCLYILVNPWTFLNFGLKYCISTWKLWDRYYPEADIVLPRSMQIDLQMLLSFAILWFSWGKTFGDPEGRMPWINCCETYKVTQSHLDEFSFLMDYNYDYAFTIMWTSSFSKKYFPMTWVLYVFIYRSWPFLWFRLR